jgi:uncharacterized protein (TIGR02145 family)
LGGAFTAGGKMKSTSADLWNTPNTAATNSSGFSAIPGGQNFVGGFGFIGNEGFWWSSSAPVISSADNAWYRSISTINGNISRIEGRKEYGHSIRCIKD